MLDFFHRRGKLVANFVMVYLTRIQDLVAPFLKLSELNLEFSSKEEAIKYAKKNNINYELIEPKSRKIIKKSYSDNFIK